MENLWMDTKVKTRGTEAIAPRVFLGLEKDFNQWTRVERAGALSTEPSSPTCILAVSL